MKEFFYLNKEALPTIPVPHDCVIKEVQLDNQNIVFVFEDDISYHDSIKHINPKARTLRISYHLTEEEAFSLYKWKRPARSSGKNGCYECLPQSELGKLSKVEYLYHNVGFCSIIIKLFSDEMIVLDAEVDYLEYEWIE